MRPRLPASTSVHDFQAQLLQAVGEAVVATDLEGTITYWNAAAERMFGWSVEEALGRHVLDRVVSPELAARRSEILGAVLAGKPWSGEVMARRKDGSPFPLHVTDAPVRDEQDRIVGVAGVGVDLTERKGTTDALRASERRVDWLTHVTSDVLYEWDVATGRVWRSVDLGQRLGVPDGRDDPEFWKDRIHPDDRHVVEDLRRAMEQGAASWAAEYRLVRGDGAYLEVLDRARILRDERGRAERVLGIMTDVTERRAAQRELDAARRALARSEKLSALGMLVSGVAHELRTPLAYVATNVHLARTRLEAAAQRGEGAAEALERIAPNLEEAVNGVDRINRLVLELRRFNRARKAPQRLVPLQRSVQAAVDLFRLASTGRAQLAVDAAPTPDVLVDDEQMQQVVLNLLDNAADAAPRGHIRVDVAATPEGARLSVHDDGPGIPPEARKRMFEAFYTTKPHGTGLGLAIVERIVREHGGSIRLESEIGAGTSFHVDFARPLSRAGPG